MFTINPQCNFPFHLPLTETVISHGGSLELVHILDRIGAVTSIKAHDRLIKGVVKARESDGLINELTPCAFWVVSIDNLDISQKHEQVYVTSSQRSWHATSIQCIEPKPLSNKIIHQICVSHDFQSIASTTYIEPLLDTEDFGYCIVKYV